MGWREIYLREAESYIEKEAGKIKKHSSVYETEAWGNENQAPFLNKVLEIETQLSAPHLMEGILSIEREIGRIRTEKKWAQRIIDIDILFFNDEIRESKMLVTPHFHLHKRKFTLIPLAEIAPDFVHPVFKKNVSQMLAECDDKLEVRLFQKINAL